MAVFIYFFRPSYTTCVDATIERESSPAAAPQPVASGGGAISRGPGPVNPGNNRDGDTFPRVIDPRTGQPFLRHRPD
jgi:hypothetical protein